MLTTLNPSRYPSGFFIVTIAAYSNPRISPVADPYPQLAARFEPLIADALNRAWDKLRKTGSLAQLSEALQSGGVGGVLEYLRDIDSVLAAELIPVLEDAIIASGRAVVEILPSGATSGAFNFTLTQPQAAAYVRQYTFELIREISTETVEAVRLAVQSGILAGRNPRSIARDFRASIGITTAREETVQRFRTALINRDMAYLSSLRAVDQRMFDLADYGLLNQKNIDDTVNGLRLRYVAQRTEVISRTESLRALSIGQDQSVQQGQLLGVMSDRLAKEWIYRGDGRTRDAHREIPDLNGQIPYNSPFVTPLGPLMFPRDPAGTAANTIQCRCRMKIVLLD